MTRAHDIKLALSRTLKTNTYYRKVKPKIVVYCKARKVTVNHAVWFSETWFMALRTFIFSIDLLFHNIFTFDPQDLLTFYSFAIF